MQNEFTMMMMMMMMVNFAIKLNFIIKYTEFDLITSKTKLEQNETLLFLFFAHANVYSTCANF
jgi:hypothetical protein